MRQGIEVGIDAQEISGLAAATWQTSRKEITQAGALGVANHTGQIGLTLNGHPVVTMHLREDGRGKVIVAILNGHGHEIAVVYPEDDGIVPPRTRKVREK